MTRSTKVIAYGRRTAHFLRATMNAIAAFAWAQTNLASLSQALPIQPVVSCRSRFSSTAKCEVLEHSWWSGESMMRATVAATHSRRMYAVGFVCCSATCSMPAMIIAQANAIPIRRVTMPVESREPFVLAAPTVRGLPDGRMLVNDPIGKRLLVFDSTMTSFTITADSARANGVSYPNGVAANPLMRYVGDSSLIVDGQARTYLVIDPTGAVARAMAPVRTADLISSSRTWPQNPGADNRGRLIFRGLETRRVLRPGDPPFTATRDTITIVRADFNLRVTDTIGTFSVPIPPSTVYTPLPNGKRSGLLTVNAGLAGPDEFAVLSDGTLAIVREHDYSVDWLNSDGTTSSSGKLPFEWIRQTDGMKQARIDSMKGVIDSVTAAGRPYGMSVVGIRPTTEGAPARFDTIIPTIQFAPLSEMADYPTPFRNGHVKADEDGNLWVLPTATSLANGGLLFDVINKKDGLHERVQLPRGYVIAGFGKGGVVYLARNDAASKTWRLARVRVVKKRGAPSQ